MAAILFSLAATIAQAAISWGIQSPMAPNPLPRADGGVPLTDEPSTGDGAA